MFTGIITDIGEVTEVNGGAFRIACNYDPETIAIGASIAADGVCLTVTELEKTKGGCIYNVFISDETFSVTTAKHWQKGQKLNLERALKLGDEFGGHIVTGHVDGFAIVKAIELQSEGQVMTFSLPEILAPFVAAKGSIALNGVSLTVNQVQKTSFQVFIIPHTLEQTNLSDLKEGDQVNIEIDMMARYAARIMEFQKS